MLYPRYKTHLGNRGENIALATLKRDGYKIIDRNFRCNLGEIDLIAARQGRISFIEVKTRSRTDFGRPEESVSRTKQKRIARIARYYLKRKKISNTPCTFSVVSVSLKDNKPRVDILENAFLISDVLPAREW